MRDKFKAMIDNAADAAEAPSGLVVWTAKEMLAKEFPPRELILDPVMRRGDLCMLYAARGVGKTWAAMGMACAIATGGSFLGWQAPERHRVLYIDGEMPGETMQARLRQILAGMDAEIEDDYLRIINPEEQAGAMPDLATPEGQQQIEPFLAGVDLVIVDNLACLVRSGKSNEEEAWRPVQSWALELRRRGIAVLFIHHAGKNGGQRGTSAREDVLTTVIKLSHPDDYKAADGARFMVQLTKNRDVFGDDAVDFIASLEVDDEKAAWTVGIIENSLTQSILKLDAEGLTQRDIAQKLRVSAATVNRHLKSAKTTKK